LVQHGASAEHALPRALAFCADRCHGCGHALPQLLEHVGRRTELGRDREPQLDSFGHDAVTPEEVPRSLRPQAPPGQQRMEPVDAGPMVHSVHQAVFTGLIAVYTSLSITSSRPTSFTTHTCSEDQKFSQRPRSAF